MTWVTVGFSSSSYTPTTCTYGFSHLFSRVTVMQSAVLRSLAAGHKPNKHKLCETGVFRQPTQRRGVVAYCNTENDHGERLETEGEVT